MSKLSIRIWANITQYGELTESSTSSTLLSDSEIERFEYRRLQAFDSGLFYSISYARQSYVLAVHFMVPKGVLVSLKHRLTTIALVIERGYKVLDAASALKGLQSSYVLFLRELQSTQFEQLPRLLNKRVSDWESQLQGRISPDPQQILINRQLSGRKGYVTFKDDEGLRGYFSHPLRLDFKGAIQILVIPQVETAKLNSVLSNQNFIAVNSAPQYTPKFALSFPDYNPQNAIALIGSLDDFFVHTFRRDGYKPIALEGKIRDHLDDWKITQSEDKTTYVIGLKFEQENSQRTTRHSWVTLIGVYFAGFLSGILLLWIIGVSSSDNPVLEPDVEPIVKVTNPPENEPSDTEADDVQPKRDVISKKSHKRAISLAMFNVKLDGIEYTYSDYSEGVEKAKAEGKYKSLQKYFEARNKALAFCTHVDNRRHAAYFRKFLSDYQEYLTQVQVNALNEILENEEIFSTCIATDVKTIKDMLDRIQID